MKNSIYNLPSLFVLAFIVLATSVGAQVRTAPLSIEALREPRPATQLSFVRRLEDGVGFSAYLVSYLSAGLKVHAMVAVPHVKAPPTGFPVLVANHGNHPDPIRYGITATGIDSRPGDYYRSIPGLFAKHGFLVVMPDYRGHNNSEGLEFTGGFLASSYYTEDVVALLAGIPSIENVDLENVFMWGHSLGGEVSLRVLLATDMVKGATLWSSVGGEIWDQAYNYSRSGNLLAIDNNQVSKPAIDKLRNSVSALGATYDWKAREPLHHLRHLTTPIVIHHAIDDQSTDYRWSMRLAKELYLGNHQYLFYSYSGSDHLFKGEQLLTAVDRDIKFFKTLMTKKK